MADLIVLAGTIEIEILESDKMTSCGGRTDDSSTNYATSRLFESIHISRAVGDVRPMLRL